MKICAPPAWKNRPVPTLDELALFCGGSADSFTGDLLRLMVRADPFNRRRLAEVFAGEGLALHIWQMLEAPTFGELKDWYQRGAAVVLSELS